jgi:hypothetical protein
VIPAIKDEQILREVAESSSSLAAATTIEIAKDGRDKDARIALGAGNLAI